jgi:PAS domain S-box-containing protein
MERREHATSDEVMRLVFDRAGVPLCLLAPNLTVLRANIQWLRWIGSTAEQLIGQDILEVFADTREVALSLYERAQRGETVAVSRHGEHANGREVWWEGVLSPIGMEGGTGVLVAARDVGDHDEEVHRAQLVTQEALASVAATVPGVLYSYQLRANGIACCPFSTPAAEEMFGLKHEDVANDIAPLFARVHRDDLPKLQESILESARTLSRWHGLFRYQHPTKGERWIEAWSLPSRQPDGSVLWHGYTTDVTERMRAQEALRETERRYYRFFQNLLELVGIHEAVRAPGGEIVDWVVRDVNEPGAALLGKAREHVIGRRFSELMPDIGRVVTTRWPDVLATGRAIQYEFVLFERVLWISVARMDVDTVAAVADDITERKRAEEALREADRRKSEFLAILSHELRNPLAPIRTAIHLLEQAGPGSDQAKRAQAVIRRQTEHLARLVDDLLDVTRFSRGKIELQRARIDLGDVVQRTCDDLHVLFEARGIALRIDMPTEPVWVDADATRMVQVVGNVLQNAAKFSREGGSVALGLSVGGGRAELRVRDDGIGVPPDLMARLFEPFVQADSSLARTRGGLGLGLALVKGLVELHGGSVSAHSEGIDRGTEVVLRLPLAAAPGRPRPEATPRPARPAVVLVIEDNVDAATTLAEVLESMGHHVHVATDGRTGLARARELRPEIILCDIGLPDVDGYEIARQLRRDAAFRSTRLVAVSGYAQPDDRRRALDAGFDAHVAKPAPLDILLASLSAA